MRFFYPIITSILFSFTLWNQGYGAIVTNVHDLLSPGQEVLVTYTKGSIINNKNIRHIFVYDSKTGQTNQITNSSMFPTDAELNITWSSFTWDGRRIVFYNKATTNVYVINKDGTNLRQITTGYWSSETWRSPIDNSDWVICAVKGDSLGPVYRINIDNGEKVLLWNKTYVGTPRYENWASLSSDGKYMTATFPWESNKGIVSVPNGNDFVNLGRGCWPSMAHDTTGDVLEINDHKRLTMVNRKGTIIIDQPNVTYFGVGPSSGWWIDKLRWSNVRDIFNFIITSAYWADQKGVAIGSFSKKSFFRLTADGDFPQTYVYSGSISTSIKPTIIQKDTVKTTPNAQVNINIFVDASPLATLQASSVPSGLTLVNGQSPSNVFSLSGKISTKGLYTVQLTATNSIGSDTKPLHILVTDLNTAPKVTLTDSIDAVVNDSTFRLTALATDDGIVQPLTYTWKFLSGPATPKISSPNNLQTAVLFSTEGIYKFELSAYDGALTSKDTIKVSVRTSVPFKILYPKAGDTLRIGSTVNVTWQRNVVAGVLVDVSINNGLSWIPLTNTTAVGTDGTKLFKWTIDDTIQPSTKCKLKIYDYFNHSEVTTTEGTFVIKAPLANITSSKLNLKNLSLNLLLSKGRINLQSNNESGEHSIFICNSLGKVIYKKNWAGFINESIKIKTNEIVFCKITSGNQSKIIKFTFQE